MTRIAPIVIASAAIGLCFLARAAEPTTLPADHPDAAALVREVWKNEEWVDHVKSLDLRLTDQWSSDAKSINARREELKRQFPEMQINEQTFPELRPLTTGTVELAFDDHRLYKRTESPEGWQLLDVRTWDGHRASMHELYPKQESFAFDKQPFQYIGRFLLNEVAWPQAGPHTYWWRNRVDNDGENELPGVPDDYHIEGTENYRGHDCYQVHTDWYSRTLLVGKKDRRVYCITQSTSAETPGQRQRQDLQIAKAFGKAFSNPGEFDTWFNALPPAQRRQVEMQQFHQMARLAVHYKEFWYDDYQEISSGCWMPMSIGYRIWNPDHPDILLADRQLKVVSAVMNQPLADKLFQPMRFRRARKSTIGATILH